MPNLGAKPVAAEPRPAEILALKDQIQHRVEEIWGVRLEPEPVMVGF